MSTGIWREYRYDPRAALRMVDKVVRPAIDWLSVRHNGFDDRPEYLSQYSTVFALLCEHPEGLTAHEISDMTGFPLSSVWPLLTDLHSHLHLIRVHDRKLSPKTDHWCSVYQVNQ